MQGGGDGEGFKNPVHVRSEGALVQEGIKKDENRLIGGHEGIQEAFNNTGDNDAEFGENSCFQELRFLEEGTEQSIQKSLLSILQIRPSMDGQLQIRKLTLQTISIPPSPRRGNSDEIKNSKNASRCRDAY